MAGINNDGAFSRIINPTSNVVGGNTGLSRVTAGPLNLFPKKRPNLQPTIAMPDQDVIAAAKKKSIADQYGRSGRASTVLSGGDTLG